MPYLDHAASSPVHPEALRAMWPYLAGGPANPSSRHEAGRTAAAALDWARDQIATALGGRPGEVVLTAGGTEADNLAVKGIALARPRGRRILTSPTEHPAVLESCRALARLAGFTVEMLPVDGAGRVRADDVATALDAGEPAALVTVATASSELGTVQPIREIAAVAAARGVPMHTDAVQAAGQIPVSMPDLGVDALTVAGHKLGAPAGVGALLVRRSVPLEPVLHGGGQQDGRRSGTEDVAGAVGLAVALHLATTGLAERTARLEERRDRLAAAVAARLPGAVLVGDPVRRLPGHLAWLLPGVTSEAVLLRLDERGVQVSSGTACAAGSTEPPEALLACGIDADLARTMVRVSFGAQTSEDELETVADELVDAVHALTGTAGAPASG
ncbi:cysteine desulfurase family protein [Georgenia deserti]|uniref:cysteine desulfurase n=1 Tax=Georgenia deserti TaxID=2093781 RepID=A0ABW4L6I4_9MICO